MAPGGPLIAKLLGGPGTADNLVAQLTNVNRGAMRVFESQIASRVLTGAHAFMEVVPEYIGNLRRPVKITVTVEFDGGEKLIKSFNN